MWRAAVLGAGLATAPLSGQGTTAVTTAGAGTLGRAAMTVDLAGVGATAAVRVDYRLQVPPGVTEIPITVLVPRPVRVTDIAARTPTRRLAVDLPDSETAQRRGVVLFPDGPPSEGLTLIVEYAVEHSVRPAGAGVEALVPVVAVDWPPADPLPGTFTARLAVPDAITLYESFPATLAGPYPDGERGLWDLELSVLPAYLMVRGQAGNAPVLSLSRAVDGGVLALLLILGAVGWRRLRAAV